ncbi:serine/threonine protein kinase [Patescibacteria group bacterium]|nr:MAG: serine/threonine protein kinase [Patescibacteria group bacterium]
MGKNSTGGARVISLFARDNPRSLTPTNDNDPASARTVAAGEKGGAMAPNDEDSASSARGADTLIGMTLKSGYRIVRKIGEGGMGVVYEGLELSLSKRVALKRLNRDLASHPEAVARAHREAEILAQLHHPNVVEVHRLVTEGAGEFMVMEFVEGKTLLEEIEERDSYLSFDDVVRIARDVLRAIEYGHRMEPQVIHRDIKAENVMVNRESDGTILWVKVLDYGVARILEQGIGTGRAALTMEKAILGTPYYMSPEVCAGGKATVQSDVYALGVAIYFMLTGHLLFSDTGTETVDDLIRAVIARSIPGIREKRPEISEKLAAVVMRALEKKASERWQSVRVFREAFEDAMVEVLSERKRQLSMRPASSPSWNPYPPVPSAPRPAQVSPNAATMAGKTADKKRVSSEKPAPRSEPPQLLPPPKPRRKWLLVATGVVAMLLPLVAVAGYRWLTRPSGSGTPRAPTTVVASVVEPPASPTATANTPRPPTPTAPAANTSVGPFKPAESERPATLAPRTENLALAPLMEACVRAPRRGNSACEQYCAASGKEDPFHRSACLFAGKSGE